MLVLELTSYFSSFYIEFSRTQKNHHFKVSAAQVCTEWREDPSTKWELPQVLKSALQSIGLSFNVYGFTSTVGLQWVHCRPHWVTDSMLSELENQNSKKVSVKVSTLLSVKKYRRYSNRYIATKVSAIPIAAVSFFLFFLSSPFIASTGQKGQLILRLIHQSSQIEFILWTFNQWTDFMENLCISFSIPTLFKTHRFTTIKSSYRETDGQEVHY
jgi:hypothetical protein